MKLFIQEVKVERKESSFGSNELASLAYHDLFDYPLTFSELVKWRAGDKVKIRKSFGVKTNKGYFFLEGKDGCVFKRILKEKISIKKIEHAKKLAGILSRIPSVKMIGLTGALAMNNAEGESDIDFMFITSKGTLWLTRIAVLLALTVLRIPRRKYGLKDQKDRLCLNLWLEESFLEWGKKDRNIYTAHEVSQVVPLVNKDGTYERFVLANSWTRKFWPNAIAKRKYEVGDKNYEEKNLKFYPLRLVSLLLEQVAFLLQYRYMKRKITNEKVGLHYALFHPNSWSKQVARQLQMRDTS